MQKGHEQQNSQLTAAQEEVARLSATVRQQEVELKELRALNRDLQRKLIDSLDSRQANSSQALPPALPAALSPPHIAEPLPQKLEVPDTADIGNGLRITTSAWQRIQTNPKDSLFVKDLMTAVWSPTELLGRSLQGKHCPRFPDRPRKEPLSPWKVSAIRECYKQRLEKKGLVPEMMPGALKQMNRFMVEKLSDIERMTKRATKELP
ncbi:BEN domain-containing protein 5 [Rhipicephalus sanguineus]|uniref:BEN domain-containing protein n=2 Tax=Rhipicephalus sanguineus TaxID=34632 RepID=A0A9D4QIH4_RHISA|nr:BEN domain-containing protein 5 [Rhipicephalus sanguineus]XP_037504048.1 BEN domain-containing protein 5 [Rhipicephalus sanguineus]KAH7982570.1 hypothetical protein HPB52_005663 [Rhipicephalus sanguineus]